MRHLPDDALRGCQQEQWSEAIHPMLQQCGHHGQGNRWSQMFVLSCEPASGQIAGRGASHRSWYSPEVRHPCAPRLHLPG
jgi:hypothetical protein